MPRRTTDVLEVAGDYSMSGTRRMQAPGNIRAGRNVRGSHGSLLGDAEAARDVERQEAAALPHASVALVVKGDKVLAVTRGSDVDDLNMPGGGGEPGEDPEETCIRELWEETGLLATDLHPIFTTRRGGKIITTYRVTAYAGRLRSSSEGIPSWEDPDVLLQSRYGDHFARTLKLLRRSKRPKL